MIFKTPEFWYGARRPFARALTAILTPFSCLYDFAFRQRMNMHHPIPLDRPVVCVGNIVAGGAGKTPVVLALVEALKNEGYNPHIVTRGYGGSEEGPLQVSPNRDTAADVGDEALLLVDAAPTWVARNRALGGQAAIDSGANVIVLDDGFQNPHVYKDVSIVVVDGHAGFGNGRVLPAGPLREAPDHALARAQAVVLIGEDRKDIRAEIARVAATPVFSAQLLPAADAPRLEGQDVYAFAGIGRPAKFRATLEAAGAKVEGWAEFPDHFAYEDVDLNEMLAAAEAKGVAVYTTAKDYVRLPPSSRARVKIYPVTLHIDDAAGLLELIKSRFGERPAGTFLQQGA